MRRWFLSYHSRDQALAERLKIALERKDANCSIFYAPTSLRAGGYWQEALAEEIAKADAFILLVGPSGMGDWQVPEYYEAQNRSVKDRSFPVVLVLTKDQTAPGLAFLRQFNWIVTPDPASEACVARLMEAAEGKATTPGELWRYTAPYRGLAAMRTEDSDYFFGRGRETVEVLKVLAGAPDKLPVLLGNSGVGKSSLAQAGVLAALARQSWPESAEDVGPWPAAFANSRQWCFLTLRPGTEPVTALVEAFLDIWQFDASDPARIRRRNEWVDLLLHDDRNTNIAELLDATERRQKELNQAKPLGFFLYVDQGEELYVRSEDRQRRRFSELLANGLGDPRLHALMSIRSDFLGALQNDQPLFKARRQIDVPPLGGEELREVVSRPASLLSARFETDLLASDIARRAAEESAKDAGALPFLSYLLDDMWSAMVKRGDGVLRLPPAAMELGGVLAERANAFLAQNPHSEGALRRLLTLKLATVREDGEPTRRRAFRSEFTDAEWRLVSALADHPNRLLVTATPEGGETYAEVAHEAIFRRWEKLKKWIADEREFLVWRGELEARRKVYDNATLAIERQSALLMGLPLATAKKWLAARQNDLTPGDRVFIKASARNVWRLGAVIMSIIGFVGFVLLIVPPLFDRGLKNFLFERIMLPALIETVFTPHVRTPEEEAALKAGEQFRECAEGTKACPLMIVIPAGEFWMGSPDGEGHQSEHPRRKVTIAKPFAVGKFEVTWDEWEACIRMRGCERLSDYPWLQDDFGFGKGSQPLVNVSFDHAKAYVAWLSRMTGKTYRLLTEAEWEYAARGVRSTDAPHPPYPWGDKASHEHANYGAEQCCDGKIEGRDNWIFTAPVGQFPPNGFGVHDMHGNVSEWVEDSWHDDYSGRPPTDGRAWTEGADTGLRVVRGGAWIFSPEFTRSAFRFGLTTGKRNHYLGFRVARTLVTP